MMNESSETVPLFGGKIKLQPSLLAADFARLGDHAAQALEAGAHGLHADIMDGRFVPQITYGAEVVRSVIEQTGADVDAHLMIVEPERQIEAFTEAGVNGVTVHAEACPHLHRVLEMIRGAGCEAGVAINPASPFIEFLQYTLPLLDRILVMTVNPGWGGQKFIVSSLDKINKISRLLEAYGSEAVIQVDGGVTPRNAGKLVNAGATELVAGSAVFKGDVGKNVAEFREAIEKELSA